MKKLLFLTICVVMTSMNAMQLNVDDDLQAKGIEIRITTITNMTNHAVKIINRQQHGSVQVIPAHNVVNINMPVTNFHPLQDNPHSYIAVARPLRIKNWFNGFEMNCEVQVTVEQGNLQFVLATLEQDKPSFKAKIAPKMYYGKQAEKEIKVIEGGILNIPVGTQAGTYEISMILGNTFEDSRITVVKAP